MKRSLTIVFFILTSLLCQATDDIFIPYSIKAEPTVGYIYPHNKNTVSPAVKGAATGGQIAFEWHTNGYRSWHIDYNLPSIGVALEVLDLSNPKVLGQMISPYAYINIPMVRSKVADFNMMLGGGLGFCTKPCDVQGAINDPRGLKGDETTNKAFDYNFIVGGPLTFNVRAALNVDFHLHEDVALTLGVGYNHFSSGSIFQPNEGLNIFQGMVGVKYHPVIRKVASPVKVQKDTIRLKRWYGEVIVAGGAKKLYYKDTRYFGCASLNVGGYYRTCHHHRVGIGVDIFYDGAYTVTAKQDASGKWVKDNRYTQFGRTFTTEDKLSNKIRVGLDIANDLIIGRFMLGFQVGIYLYNPVKNMEPFKEAQEAANDGKSLNKGLFYAYDINKEDGWNYFRLSCKYYITKHLLAQIAFKTHLQKVEFVEFGIGSWF